MDPHQLYLRSTLRAARRMRAAKTGPIRVVRGTRMMTGVGRSSSARFHARAVGWMSPATGIHPSERSIASGVSIVLTPVVHIYMYNIKSEAVLRELSAKAYHCRHSSQPDVAIGRLAIGADEAATLLPTTILARTASFRQASEVRWCLRP